METVKKGRVLSEYSNATLVDDDDVIMLTKWFFDLRVRFSGTSWVLSEHSNVTLVGDDDALMLIKWFFDLRVRFSGTSWVTVTRTVRMNEA